MYGVLALALTVCAIISFVEGDSSSGYSILTIGLLFSLMSQISEFRKEMKEMKEETAKEINKKMADAVVVSSVLNALTKDKDSEQTDSVVEKE